MCLARRSRAVGGFFDSIGRLGVLDFPFCQGRALSARERSMILGKAEAVLVLFVSRVALVKAY